MIYGLLNADISDNATVYCAIPFGHYMGVILSLSINTPVQIMKNNIKKAPVKFRDDLLYFQHFMLIFVFVPN